MTTNRCLKVLACATALFILGLTALHEASAEVLPGVEYGTGVAWMSGTYPGSVKFRTPLKDPETISHHSPSSLVGEPRDIHNTTTSGHATCPHVGADIGVKVHGPGGRDRSCLWPHVCRRKG